ncbi:MAG: hypothetical protein PHI12_11250 [Dehalococcoidales bacterium]|nr:hypothetical protein [Dehalococcoidales bacterium]
MAYSLSLSLSKTVAVKDIEEITFSGYLKDGTTPLVGKNIDIWFKPPNNNAFRWGTRLTDSRGRYEFTLAFNVSGEWRTETVWEE